MVVTVTTLTVLVALVLTAMQVGLATNFLPEPELFQFISAWSAIAVTYSLFPPPRLPAFLPSPAAGVVSGGCPAERQLRVGLVMLVEAEVERGGDAEKGRYEMCICHVSRLQGQERRGRLASLGFGAFGYT